MDYRQSHLRSLSHLPAGLEAPPRFLERVAVHYARNQLAGLGALPGQVPLILGIWGPKVRHNNPCHVVVDCRFQAGRPGRAARPGACRSF